VTLRGWLVALVLLLCSFAVQAGAQNVPGAPNRQPPLRPGARDTIRNRADTLRTRQDSAAAADTTGVANFLPPDSVMQRLMALPGFSITRYQGEIITFQAATRGASLTNRAIVQRDSQIVKSDTILYSGESQGVQAIGKRNVFVVPGQATPIVTTGPANYDMSARRIAGTGVKTAIEAEGQTLFVSGERYVAVQLGDSLRSANDINYYFKNGVVTACDDSIPDYYFKSKEIKRTGSFVVGRPAVLYIGDVPVMWLPFVFQDVRGGRHSGILPPNVGVSDIVRNSPSYRRNVEGLGYYWAVSDYVDAQAFIDWRSSAGQTEQGDPGYFRYNAEMRYRWLDRYIAGNLAASQTTQGNARNTAITWGHQQNFTKNSSLSANINYATNTILQRETTSNPYSALATISSTANYQQKVGPAQFSLGGTNRQYPGRSQVDRSFPTVSLSTSPISVGSWLTWTPNFSYASTQTLNIDQPSALGLFARREVIAGVDTVLGDTLKKNAYTSTLSFDTPLTIFGYSLGNRFTINSARNDFPERAIVADVATGVEQERIYAQTYHTEVDWTPSFTLPSLGRNKFNLTPSVSLSNVDGGAFWIRNERTGQATVVRPVGGADAVRAVRSRREGLRTVRAHPACDPADVRLLLRAGSGGERRVSAGARPHAVQLHWLLDGLSPLARAELAQRRIEHEHRGEAPFTRRHQSRRRREDQAAVGQLHGGELRLRARACDRLAHSRADDAELRLQHQVRPAARRRFRRRLFAVRRLDAERHRAVLAVPRAHHRRRAVQRPEQPLRRVLAHLRQGRAPDHAGHRSHATFARRQVRAGDRLAAGRRPSGANGRLSAVDQAGMGRVVHVHVVAPAAAGRESVEHRGVRSRHAMRAVQHAGAARALR
jgi:hypothetical protein